MESQLEVTRRALKGIMLLSWQRVGKKEERKGRASPPHPPLPSDLNVNNNAKAIFVQCVFPNGKFSSRGGGTHWLSAMQTAKKCERNTCKPEPFQYL